MTKPKKALLFVSDFTDRGDERLFLWSLDDNLIETSAEDVLQQECEFVCHDYWLVAPAIYRKTLSLPMCVTDIDELRISTSGKREDRENRDRVDFSTALIQFVDGESISRYKKIIYKNSPIDIEVFRLIGSALLQLADSLETKARAAGEWERYIQIERPVADYLVRAAADGIAIDEVALRKHKAKIDFSFYIALKEFSAKFSLPLEVPSDDELIDYLESKYDFSGVGLEFVLNFIPMSDGFSDDLLQLRKLAAFRKVLNAIPLSQKRVYPIVDTFGSITSRIYFKDPSLQNLSKHHRDILRADEGMVFSYIDYDQYEAGIMGALSQDEKLLEYYSSGDLYAQAAEEIFSDREKRKLAKRLFLSYAYGMKRKSLIDAAAEFGANRNNVKNFFNQFLTFEKWKQRLWEEFRINNKIGTILGNYLTRDRTGELSEKEKRSAVSQVVQGTASLIFKKALIRLSCVEGIGLKVPMHDAVLFQHSAGFDPSIVANLFATVMSEHFDNSIQGKASLSKFTREENP